ncbi:MAG: hypothetical protein GY943_23465 [Chloroflexi bacterium]|nr:hypothetical protein [Chloroflexota bacterium]
MTTKNRKRPNRQMGLLKWAMAVGSLAASLLGTRILAQQELAPQTAVSPTPIVINVPLNMPTTLPMEPQTASPNSFTLDLAPIPEAVSPQIKAAPPPQIIQVAPVAQSQSSK